MTVFTHASVISGRKLLPDHSVWVDGGKIIRVCASGRDCEPRYGDATVIDAGGKYLSAGFIDLHVHGGMGHDFMDATREAFEGIAAHHSSHGVTSMLATTLACADNETFAFLDAYGRYAANIDTCRYLGAHLEGPYFSLEQRGAQDPLYIRTPSPGHYEKFLEYGCVKRFSAAPELEGGYALGECLRGRGILASIAHSDADFDQAVRAMEHGYTLVTHLYSGMKGVHRRNAYRYGGLIEAALLLDGLTAEVIADNRHLPECLLKLIYKCKGRDGITLCSDAMRGAGLAEGRTTKIGSLAQGQDAIIEDGVAKLPDRTAFAGSVASGDRLVRTMVKVAGVPLPEAIGMMTINPARLLGLSDVIGDAREGMEADLIVFDGDINVERVMVAGKMEDGG